MKKLIFIGFLLCSFLSANAFAEAVPTQITEGRFFIAGNQRTDFNNALLTTGLFSALSSLGGDYSPWTDICKRTPRCRLGETFTVPENSQIFLGGCIGCSGSQFPTGAVTIGGKTYQNAYFKGDLTFNKIKFLIPKRLMSKRAVTFRKPFTLKGNFQVCQESDRDRACPADKILFSGEIAGKGTLFATMEVKIWNDGARSFPYLIQKSFDYKFEK